MGGRARGDHWDPGWLADGSGRYPVRRSRPECGSGDPGVHTLSPSELGNGTSLFGAYCFKGMYKKKATSFAKFDQNVFTPCVNMG